MVIAGGGEGASGPHRAQELLQLTEGYFSPMVDTLQALRVFGEPGRQVTLYTLKNGHYQALVLTMSELF